MIDATQHFRIYAVSTCPLCKQLADIFTEKGIVAGLTIIDGDPVLMRGVAAFWEDNTAHVPLLLCSSIISGYTTKKLVIRGFQEGRIRELLDAYVAAHARANAPNAIATQGEPVQQAAPMVAESQSVAG